MSFVSYFFDFQDICPDQVLIDWFYRENQNSKTAVTSEMP